MRLNILSISDEKSTNYYDFNGTRWSIKSLQLDEGPHSDKSIPDFICISYAWGTGKHPSPFHSKATVSDRTIPALLAAIRLRPNCKAFWIDALCVPSQNEPVERVSTLESMGYIYSHATEVIAVLSEAATPMLIQACVKNAILQPEQMAALEKETWFLRAWTYQESVNSKVLHFTTENCVPGLEVELSQFLSCLGFTLCSLGSETRKHYAHLDGIEDFLADAMLAGYLNRSAFQVMSIMRDRDQERPEDHFYAMIGAITTERASHLNATSPCEAFMSLCERKSDFSFIYSAALRDPTLGRRWRPLSSGNLPVILATLSWGSGQSGRYDDSGRLYLNNMFVLRRGSLHKTTISFIEKSLLVARKYLTFDIKLPLANAASKALQERGFTGSLVAIKTASGLFFPQWTLEPARVALILVATSISWTFGAPGLAQYQEDGTNLAEYVPGVFWGQIENEDQVAWFNMSDEVNNEI